MANEIVKAENTELTGINAENPLGGMYCSLKADNRADQLKVFAAVTNAEKLEDHINERLDVEHVIIQPVRMTDKLTGEVTDANRIVLYTADGRAFGCVSEGVEVAIKQLFGIVGLPPWTPPIAFKAVKQQSNKGAYKYTTLVLWE